MSKFFGRNSRSRRSEKETPGLSDKTNFPLLSTTWVRTNRTVPDNTTNFSARRLLRFGGTDSRRNLTQTRSPPEDVKPDSKAASPPHDVASAWMQMGSETTSFDAVEPSLSSRSSNDTTQNARTDVRTTEQSSRSHHSNAAIKATFSTTASNNTNLHSNRSTISTSSSVSTASSQRPSRLSSSSNGGNNRAPSERASRFAPHSSSRTNTANKMKRTKNDFSSSASQCEWRSAVDPKSGRTYYYNMRTRETQWRKPMELASPEERKEMQDKERKQKDFFAAMEANILKQMATGQVPGTPTVSPNNGDVKMAEAQPKPRPSLEKPRMVRTISGMDDQILRELVKRVPSYRGSKMNRDNSMSMEELGKLHDTGHLSNISEESMGYMSNSMNMSEMEISLADINYDMEDKSDDSPSAKKEKHALRQLAKTAQEMADASGSAKASPAESPKTPPKIPSPKGTLRRPTLDSRRNTCGTMYVGSTMSAPDKDATIKVRHV